MTSDYTDDLVQPITPNKLIYSRNLDVINLEDNEYMQCANQRKREQYVNALLRHFWTGYVIEYVMELREHHVNDTVLLKNDNSKRSD